MTERAQPADLQLSSSPVRRQSTQRLELDGRALVFDTALRHWIVLNPTADAVWQGLDGALSVTEIADDLCAFFAGDAAKVQEEVLHMVRVFGQQGFLEGVVPVPGGPGIGCPRATRPGSRSSRTFPPRHD
jgi:hypothetical protein